MARPSNTRARRRQIAEALIRVMARHGYHEASISKVAKEAKLATGLVLYHFESKEAILLDAVESLSAALDRRYRARLEHAGGVPRAQLHAFIDAHLALDEDADPASVAAWVVIAGEAVRAKEVRELYAASVRARLDELERLVRAVQRSAHGSAKGGQRIAAAILAAIEGSFVLASAAPGLLPAGYAAPALRAMVDGLLE